MTGRLKALSLHSKLTLIFAVVMAAVLAGVGAFLFYQTKSDLDAAIAQSLRSRAGSLIESIRARPPGASAAQLIQTGERFAQVLAPDGRVLDTRPQGIPALLHSDELQPVRRFLERGEDTRLLVTPFRSRGRLLLAVNAASLADREHALEGLARALLIGGPLALSLASALAYWLGSATLRPVESMRRRAAEITEADQAAQLPVPAGHDEIHRLAVTLNDMLARLADSAEHQRAFAAHASHELRTPIATLRTELELALRHSRNVEELQAACRRALGDADGLAQLASDLLALAQVDRNAPNTSRRLTDLDQLLADAADEARKHPRLHGREVRYRPGGVSAHVDPSRIAQALSNMARNAVVHGEGPITLGADHHGDTVTVWVQDQGPPLPPELHKAAFRRFVRGRDAADRPGAGLGLAIVEEVARAHDGTARFVTADGQVRCELTLPARHRPADR